MDAPENRAGLFAEWTRDYKKVAKAEGKKVFTFTPDDPVTNPAELTMALCRYGEQQGVNLVVTKESMAPEFEIDGIPYTAQLVWRRMGPGILLIVRCTALHPEQLESDVPKARSRWMKLVHYGWPVALFVLLWGAAGDRRRPGQLAGGGTGGRDAGRDHHGHVLGVPPLQKLKRLARRGPPWYDEGRNNGKEGAAMGWKMCTVRVQKGNEMAVPARSAPFFRSERCRRA